MNPRPNHHCILLVEDEMALAMLVEDILDDAGYQVLKAARVSKALALAHDAAIDAAILDINLCGKEVFPVAEQLRARGIPFMFASGYGESGIPEQFADCLVLQKPYLPPVLEATLAQVLDGAARKRRVRRPAPRDTRTSS